jgi:hypothetical protein
MRKSLVVIVAGLALASAAAAHADSTTTIQQVAATMVKPAGGSNTSNITQVGNNNYAETDQTGLNPPPVVVSQHR